MSTTRDAIARRVAEKLGRDVDPKVPAYVDKLIALGPDADALDDAPPTRTDNATALALAQLVLSATTLAIGVIQRYQDEKRRAQDEQRRREEEQRRAGAEDRAGRLAEDAVALAHEAVAISREALARELRTGLRFPEVVEPEVREALVDEVAEQALAEAKHAERGR